jgi:hypothetical protein
MVKILNGADLIDQGTLDNAVLRDVSTQAPNVQGEIGYDSAVGNRTGFERGLAWFDGTDNSVRTLASVALNELSALTADMAVGAFTFQSTKTTFADSDLVTKSYITGIANAQDMKQSVLAATAATLTLGTDYDVTGSGVGKSISPDVHTVGAVSAGSDTFTISGVDYSSVYTNGSSFVITGSGDNDGTYTVLSVTGGANTVITTNEDITGTGLGSIQKTGVLSIDGNTTWTDVDNDAGSTDPFATGSKADRVLLKDMSDAADNGIYHVKEKGAAGTPYVLVRATDFDGSPANEVSGGNTTWVETGTANGDTRWTVSGTGDLTVETDNINWTQSSGAGSVTAGDGIRIDGSQVNVDLNENLSVLGNNLASGDKFLVSDESEAAAADKAKTITIDNIGTFLAGATNGGIGATSGQLTMQIDELAVGGIASGDTFAFDNSGTTNKITVDNYATFLAGLANGGIDATNGQLEFNLNDLATTAGQVDVDADSIAFYNADGTATENILVQNFFDDLFITDGFATTSTVASGDQLMIDDGGVTSRVSISDFVTQLQTLGLPKMYTALQTTTVASTQQFPHSLNTTYVLVEVIEVSSGNTVYTTTTIDDANNVTVDFGANPSASGTYRVIVIGTNGLVSA